MRLIRAGIGAILIATSPQASSQSLDRPCSFITAAEMSGLLGATVASATDERSRCKYVVGKGWLETKLMNFELKITRDIYDYNKTRGKLVPGVGDQAYLLGATLAAKVGDVAVVVDASNLPGSNKAQLEAVAKKIIKAIP